MREPRQVAVLAESLYLANLLVLPGLAFALLLLLWWRNRHTSDPLIRCHLQQTLSASIWAGIALLLVAGSMLVFALRDSMAMWVVLILYFTICHSTLVVFGALGLSRAMAEQCWRFPLVGRPLPPH